MNRNNFGLWGLDLSQDDFAKALAAVGVFQNTIDKWPTTLTVRHIYQKLSDAAVKSHGLVGWRLGLVPPEELGKLKGSPSASLFADAWEQLRKSYKGTLRFELYPDKKGDYFWISEQLLSSVAGKTSLYVRADEPEANVGWKWPLRVGFLKGNASQQLRSQLENSLKQSGLKQLVDFVNLEAEGDECDLLLLPQGLRAALSEVLGERSRPRADCVLVLGGSKELPEATAALINALRTQARTGGVGLLFIPEESRQHWFYRLITNLSHDHPLDVALFKANREVKAPTLLLAASRRLIDLSRVSTSAKRLRQSLQYKVAAADVPTSSTPPLSQRRGGTLGGSRRVVRGISKGGGKGGGGKGGSDKGGRPRSARPVSRSIKKNGGHHLPTSTRGQAVSLARDLQPEHLATGWDKESGAATEIAESSRAARSFIEELPRKPAERRIQAQLFGYANSRRGKQERVRLKPDAPYVVDIYIGPPSAERENAPEAFPVEKLPPSDKGHDLTIVFSEPNVMPEPRVETLHLPPEGSTEACSFYFQTRAGLDAINARIIVLHRNRVIQTAILSAPITARSGAAVKGTVKLEIETRVLPDINDLTRRQQFDAALVLNQTDDGQPSATAVAGAKAMTFSFDEAALKDTIQTLNGELTTLAEDPDSFPEDLEAESTTRLLNMLARHGRMLYKHLFVLRPDGKWLVDKDKKKIQIISTRRASNLPLEFLYDYGPPEMGAKLCSYATKALPTGQCDQACLGREDKKVICPLGFWGLNRVIERHTHDDSISAQGDYVLQASPASQRKPLEILDKALFAASNVVEKRTVKKVEKALKANTIQTDYVSNWDDWVAKIKANSPSLLVLLSHTEDNTEDKMPALEISEKLLSTVDIEEEHVRKPGATTGPVVMLIGCKTNAPDNMLHSFVAQFSAYASIVVSTGATVLALQAAQVAIEFVQALSKLSQTDNATFGDAMLDMRRRLLAKGLPMVLCLSAYGDADWYLKQT